MKVLGIVEDAYIFTNCHGCDCDGGPNCDSGCDYDNDKDND